MSPPFLTPEHVSQGVCVVVVQLLLQKEKDFASAEHEASAAQSERFSVWWAVKSGEAGREF